LGVRVRIKEMKSCTKCKIEKELEEFYVYPSGKYRAACKECYIKHRNTIGKNKQLKKRYGINIDQYNDLFTYQKGCCAICGIHQSKLSKCLAVDHCHKTLVIRGLLCYNCNSGLGRFKDNLDVLKQASEYLIRSNDLQDTTLRCPQ